MSFNFDNNIPIYLQIVEDIKLKIIRKEYSIDEKIPSVRDLSLIYEVNPNTIQKALGELEEIGLIYTERTNGKFVTKDEGFIGKIRKESINLVIEKFYEDMCGFGINKEDVLKILTDKEKK